MNKYFLFIFFVLILIVYFLWGVEQKSQAVKAECEKEIIVKEKEVIKYVSNQKSSIYAKPNASRSSLLEFMQHNKL